MANVGIIQGTTPTVIFRITDENFDFSKIDNVSIVFEYDSNQMIKGFEDVDIDSENKTISASLSQEETLSIPDGRVHVQLRVLINDGSTYGQSLATPIQIMTIKPILEKKVITKYE